jgi:hypothetical protein
VIEGFVPREDIIKILHDLEYFIGLDPYHIEHKTTEAPEDGATRLPFEIRLAVVGETEFFEAKDRVPGAVGKLFPGKATATNRYQLTRLKDGFFAIINAALDINVCHTMTVAEEAGTLVLCDCVEVTCPRLCMEMVKSQEAENLPLIYKSLIERAGGKVGLQSVQVR